MATLAIRRVAAWLDLDPVKIWRLSSFGIACLALAWAVLDTLLIARVFGDRIFFGDSTSYWRAWHGPLYDPSALLSTPHFVYAPPAALAFWAFAQLPEGAFVVLWAAVGTAVYVWLLAPLPLHARVPAIAAGTLFALNGNIEWLLALVAVFGLRWPTLWLVALFTKAAPFLGFAWFVIRREWGSVARTALVGFVIVGVSAILLPGAWPTWIGMVRAFGSQTETSVNPLMPAVPFAVRLVGAAALLLWGARRGQPIVLPFVLALCQPDMQPWAIGFLAAVPRLLASELPMSYDVSARNVLSDDLGWRERH